MSRLIVTNIETQNIKFDSDTTAFTIGSDGIVTGNNAPAMKLLTTSTGNGVATLDITTGFSTTYDTYFVTYVAQPATDGPDAYIRVFTDQSGGSIDGTGMFGREALPMDGGGTQNTDNSSLYFSRVNRYGIRSHVNMGIQGWAYILNRNSSTIMTSISGQSNNIQTGTSNHNLTVYGGTQTTDVDHVVTGIRFVFGSGNINNGTLKLYGIK